MKSTLLLVVISLALTDAHFATAAKSIHKHCQSDRGDRLKKPPSRSRNAEEELQNVQRVSVDIESMKEMFEYPFSQERYEPEDKNKVVKFLTSKLQSLGWVVRWHYYTITDSGVDRFGVNVIAQPPGVDMLSDEASKDWLIISAHYDTVSRAPGVVDDGSGSVGLLELIRVFSESRCQFEFKNLWFIWFDQEEAGLLGSKAFVDEVVKPKLIDGQIKSLKMIQMDMILTQSPEINSQLNFFGQPLELIEDARKSQFRGDFISVMLRDNNQDNQLADAYMSSWSALNLPRSRAKFHPVSPVIASSDQSSFWAIREPNIPPIEAIVLYDNGVERAPYRDCYHRECDDKRHLTQANLDFMKDVLDALSLAILYLTGGRCATDDIDPSAPLEDE